MPRPGATQADSASIVNSMNNLAPGVSAMNSILSKKRVGRQPFVIPNLFQDPELPMNSGDRPNRPSLKIPDRWPDCRQAG